MRRVMFKRDLTFFEVRNIELVDCLPLSPDLYPIENNWSHLKYKIRKNEYNGDSEN